MQEEGLLVVASTATQHQKPYPEPPRTDASAHARTAGDGALDPAQELDEGDAVAQVRLAHPRQLGAVLHRLGQGDCSGGRRRAGWGVRGEGCGQGRGTRLRGEELEAGRPGLASFVEVGWGTT